MKQIAYLTMVFLLFQAPRMASVSSYSDEPRNDAEGRLWLGAKEALLFRVRAGEHEWVTGLRCLDLVSMCCEPRVCTYCSTGLGYWAVAIDTCLLPNSFRVPNFYLHLNLNDNL